MTRKKSKKNRKNKASINTDMNSIKKATEDVINEGQKFVRKALKDAQLTVNPNKKKGGKR